MLVFAALMMHKGPAAFGLTAFLLQQKQSLKTSKKFLSFAAIIACSSFLLPAVWKLLIAFASVAPAAALITYVVCVDSSAGGWLAGAVLIRYDRVNDRLLAGAHLGILMLFSAGTFLFVACVHILPEISPGHQVISVQFTIASFIFTLLRQAMEWSLLASVCIGTLLPALFDAGNHQH
jgi:zinc transporter 9